MCALVSPATALAARGREVDDYHGSERLRKMQQILDRLLQLLPKTSDAYGFAFDLAGLLHQTEKCKKCGGRGTHDRHQTCRHSSHGCYVSGCYEQVLCRKCGGVGKIYVKQLEIDGNVTDDIEKFPQDLQVREWPT